MYYLEPINDPERYIIHLDTHTSFKLTSAFQYFLTNLIRVSLFLNKYQIRLETDKRKRNQMCIKTLFVSSISLWLPAKSSVPQLQRVAFFALYTLKIKIRKQHDTGG